MTADAGTHHHSKLTDLVTDLAVKLEKALDPAKQDVATVEDLLASLDKVEMTVDLLKLSKVGFAVKKVKSNADLGAGVVDKAAKLLKKWKKAVAGGGGGGSSSNGNGGEAGGSPSSASAAAPAKEKEAGNGASSQEQQSQQQRPPSGEGGEGAAAGAAKAKVENGSTVEECLPEAEAAAARDLPQARLKIANLFLSVFLKHEVGTDDRERAARVAVGIEAAMDAATDHKAMTKQYGDKARSLKYNLDTNEHLRFRVVVGDIDPVTLVNMKPEDMQPEEHRKAAEEAAKLEYESKLLDWHDKNADKIRAKLGIEDVGGSFTCGRCKGNKTTYQAKQTRSSDEPMTMFIRCLTCGNRWKEN